MHRRLDRKGMKMDVIGSLRRWLNLEQRKESIETLAERIAEQIRIYHATKTDLDKEEQQEFKLEHGMREVTEKEIRELETLINDIRKLHSQELDEDAKKILQDLREQDALFAEVENIVQTHHEDEASLPHLIHEQILKSRDAKYRLQKDERKVA